MKALDLWRPPMSRVHVQKLVLVAWWSSGQFSLWPLVKHGFVCGNGLFG